ncbi:hypothetical protein [Mycolicibacterium aichiense]|uniref:Uncharacterized protein n=1 Tax=Mycolicibacterium aichiense TaxID=1799 RepID=A0AAD1HR05_9MYCO|nr:hypothetical protein [Mycolicibacterium aichiense]QFG08019.1 hypothetical protein SEA_HERBERTWM_50 [Mycobacterium phage Herbertwm]BBX09446.1 hypothetical protein MAIC_42490 [Mycolicibacterium aichiense]
MSYDDPFADAPAQPEPTPEPTQAPAPAPAQTAPAPVATAAAPVAVSPSGDLSVTFKGDGSYGFPWIVPKYTSVSEALVDLGVNPDEVSAMSQGRRWISLFERAKQMNDSFAALGGGAPSKPAGNGGGGGGQQQQSRAPQEAKEAPNGEKQYCQHGEMEYKSGISKKTGKPYALFSCTAPRDEQCAAKWPSK